jgi:hypothetical protein
MGGVLDVAYDWHTFDKMSGRELEITDVLIGSKDRIVEELQEAFVAEHGELNGKPSSGPMFALMEKGVAYAPDNIFGFQRGLYVTIPYSRTEFVKAPFAKR